MASTSDLHVVFGAGGGIGGGAVRELAARGHRVRAVTRSGQGDPPAGVEPHQADLTDPAAVERAAAGAAVVSHCAQPPDGRWPQRFPPLTRAVLDGTAAAGAKLAYADNLYAYGPVDRPMTQDLPSAATFPKGRTRAAMARLLLDAHAAGRLRVAIGRASDDDGPGGGNSTAGAPLFASAVTGSTARRVGRLAVAHPLSYLPDIARGLVVLGERDEADGQAWHLPAAQTPTMAQFLGLVFEVLGRRPRFAAVGLGMQRLLGVVNPAVGELRETAYQRERPFVLDAGRFERAFGPLPATPHRQAVAETLDWFRRHGSVN
jgi:nucleoside-diphosphate-sugar epimerase